MNLLKKKIYKFQIQYILNLVVNFKLSKNFTKYQKKKNCYIMKILELKQNKQHFVMLQ